MFSAFRSWGRVRSNGHFGWLEVLLVLAGALMALLLQPRPNP